VYTTIRDGTNDELYDEDGGSLVDTVIAFRLFDKEWERPTDMRTEERERERESRLLLQRQLLMVDAEAMMWL
jgi:hypothetical protein